MTTQIFSSLYRDEAGFIVSAELILISTIVVIGMIVGLSEVSNNVNQELEDVGSAIASLNQSFVFSGAAGHKGKHYGSRFKDTGDYCDSEYDITCDAPPQPELGKNYHW